MGFFDGFIKGTVKNAAKKIANDVVDNVLDDVIGNVKVNENTFSNSKVNSKPENFQINVQSFNSSSISVTDCIDRNFEYYDTDENKQQVIIECKFQLPKEFLPYDTGAAEIDSCYVYSPSEVSKGYASDFEGKPYIYFGFDEFSHRIIDDYLKNNTVKDGVKLTKIEDNFAKYRTERSMSNEYFTTYYYYRKFDSKLMYHIALSVLKKMLGTEFHKKMENVLDNVICTYSDTVKYE